VERGLKKWSDGVGNEGRERNRCGVAIHGVGSEAVDGVWGMGPQGSIRAVSSVFHDDRSFWTGILRTALAACYLLLLLLLYRLGWLVGWLVSWFKCLLGSFNVALL